MRRTSKTCRLLPRVLEVLAAGEWPSTVALEVSLKRFPTGDRAQWSEAEWDVLDRFPRQYLAWQKGEAPQREMGAYLDDVICMFALAGWPVEALITQVSAQPDRVLAHRLWWCGCQGRPSIWITALWDGQGAWDFYSSPALAARMERLAFDPATGSELAEKALAVVEVIQAASGGPERA